LIKKHRSIIKNKARAGIFLKNQFATNPIKAHPSKVNPSLAPFSGALVKDGFLDKFESRFI